MSDLFVSAGIEINVALLSREMRFTEYTKIESGGAAGVTWAVSRLDDFALWGPAWDRVSQTRVLIGGRIALEEIEWAAAEQLPYEGGLAARHLLSRWLARGSSGVMEYNGAALVVIIDERQGELHIWTDRMGFFPAFAIAQRGVIIASHPDVIAKASAASGQPLSIDDLTIAEFLHTGTSVHPHTYWRGINHLDAASQYQVRLPVGALRKCTQYWRPAFIDNETPMRREDFVETFADALRAAGRRRSLSRLGRTAILLSSGADSRGVLATMRSPREVDCFTYFDEPNDELRGARTIAALADTRHFALQRSPDYYAVNAEETVRLSGGMWGIESGHHTGFVASIRDQSQPGGVLTGCYCDYLFKGLALNRRHRRVLGGNLPLYKIDAYNPTFYLPFTLIEPQWSTKVNERLADRIPPSLQEDVDPRKVELARISPICREGDASGRLTLWRTLPFDVFVADNDILNAYGRMSVADKISGIAFGQAVARITGPDIAAVPNNNFGASVGTSEAGRLVAFFFASARRKARSAMDARKREGSIATEGSWPNYRNVALNSALMRHRFDGISNRHGELLLTYLHPSRRNWSYEEFAMQDVAQLYRLITVDLWLQQIAPFTNNAGGHEQRETALTHRGAL